MKLELHGFALVMVAAAAVPTETPEQVVVQPDAEFLEFLGSFGDEEGSWVDPFTVEEMMALSDDPETLDEVMEGEGDEAPDEEHAGDDEGRDDEEDDDGRP